MTKQARPIHFPAVRPDGDPTTRRKVQVRATFLRLQRPNQRATITA
jgi:hypothetical protein